MLSMFQHTAARRRLAFGERIISGRRLFQHTAARRRLGRLASVIACNMKFQHTAARRRLVVPKAVLQVTGNVSTHSRPKAAGLQAV